MSPWSAAAPNAPGFVPFDPSAAGPVSGAHLLIAAYAVICGFLAVYALSIFFRSRALAKRAQRLESRLEGGRRPPGRE
jgi:hypothetical protein